MSGPVVVVIVDVRQSALHTSVDTLGRDLGAVSDVVVHSPCPRAGPTTDRIRNQDRFYPVVVGGIAPQVISDHSPAVVL